MIMVFPNGGRSTMYQDSGDGRFMAETTFIRELMPHIDATYRTIADRKARCIEGFSVGGRGSTHLAMKYPELFGSLFNQSGTHGHFPSAQYRGYKSDIWDGGYRVAFCARWPDKVKVASQSAQLICHTDLMATCAEILGVKLPENAGEDSVSILPALLGTDRQPLREAVAHHSINGSFAIRQGSWKLELCPGSGGWGKPGDAEAMKQGMPGVQLYDLSADFAETKNVQAEHPEIVASMTRLLEQKVTNGRSTPGVRQSSDARIVLFKSNPAKAPRE